MVIRETGIRRIRKRDSGFLDEIKEEGGENILKCFQCGTCVGFCPAGMTTGFRTRSIIKKAQMGFKDEVLESQDLWFCTTCYTCLERCPRGAGPTDIIIALRRLAAKEGHMPSNFIKNARNLFTTGHIVPLKDAARKRRTDVGLPESPPTTLTFKDALTEVQKIADTVGSKKLFHQGDRK